MGGYSHERQKVDIYNQIEDMHSTMRSFTSDIETRLDNMYKDGAGKKWGYDDIAENVNKKINAEMSAREKELNKMEA